MTWLRQALSWLGALALATAAGCGQTQSTESGETHFLLACRADTCAAGFECLCGACSRPCSEDAECDALGGAVTCVEHDASQCRTVTKSCDVACDGDSDCQSLGAAYTCSSGFCRAGAAQPEPEPEPEPAAPRACEAGCGASECAAPGSCSLESACKVVDCDSLIVDANACVRPACTGDADCPADERCTSVYLSRHYDCAESSAVCDCSAGLGLFPLHLCSPVELAGTRGEWETLEVHFSNLGNVTDWTLYPDGRVDRMADTDSAGAQTLTLTPEDMDELERTVNGTALRLALANADLCRPGGKDPVIEDLFVTMKLSLDTSTLSKDVTGCIANPQIDQPYSRLLELARQY